MGNARLLLVLVLSAAAVQHSECNFWDTMTTGVTNAVSWVRNNCNSSWNGGLSVQCQFSGRKRTALEMRRKAVICDQLGFDDQVLSSGFTLALVQTVFNQVDAESGEASGVLDDKDLGSFLETLDLLRNCIHKTA